MSTEKERNREEIMPIPDTLARKITADFRAEKSMGAKKIFVTLWFIRHLSDGLYIFHTNLWNLPSDIYLGLAIRNVRCFSPTLIESIEIARQMVVMFLSHQHCP